jgi:glucose/arabinose dehydrogenase
MRIALGGGEVVAVDLDSGEREVLLDGLAALHRQPRPRRGVRRDRGLSLWTRGEDVRADGGGEPEPFLAGLANPQHLLVLADGTLLVGEHGPGAIHGVARAD